MNGLISTVVQATKKYSPEILMILGIAGIGAGTVMACKETTQIEPIIEEHNEQMDEIHKAHENNAIEDLVTHEVVEYSEKDYRRDTAVAYFRTGYKLAKLYAPSVLLIGGSIGCIIGSHTIMSKRNAGLALAYAGISESFNKYREKIIEKYGEAVDAEARYDLKAKKVKGKDGEPDSVEYTKSDKTLDYLDLSRFFDAESKYWDKNANMNLMTIHSFVTNVKRRLRDSRSHELSFNALADMLDIRPAGKQGNMIGVKYRPGQDELDENGLPNVFDVMIYKMNNKGEKVKKSLDEVISDVSNGIDTNECIFLLEFKGLELLYQ